MSVFGGSAWEYVPERGQYYLHFFAKEQPDLNWDNPETKENIFDIIRFWNEKGVDGYRIDAINYSSAASKEFNMAIPFVPPIVEIQTWSPEKMKRDLKTDYEILKKDG